MPLTNEAQERRTIGLRLLSRGLFVAARDELRRWLSLVEPSGDPAYIIPALNALAAAEHGRGEMDSALQYLRRAQSHTEEASTPDVERLRVILNLMMVETDRGNLEGARALAEPAERLLQSGGLALSHVYWLNMSMLYWRRQEWVPMRHASREAYEHSNRAGEVIPAAKALTNLGIAHLELGAHRMAERDLLRAIRMCEQVDRFEAAYAHAELGRLHFLRGNLQEALEAGRNALSSMLTDVAGLDKEELARISRLFGNIFFSLGQRNLALKYLNRSAAYFSQIGLRAEWQRSTDLIGKILSQPAQTGQRPIIGEVQRLDFLTAVLDLTDDLESVDPYLRGHSERVARLALMLGQSLALPEEDLGVLTHAARLHDVGMVAVETDLIHREGRLTEAELRRVALHCAIGEEMLRPYGLSTAGLKAIRHHHEHYDGTGYPEGLSGEAIPFLARVVSIVDVYDALTSARIYRPAMDHDQAVEELRSMAGRELDPGLVQRFLDLHSV